jgi:hypothetical protein
MGWLLDMRKSTERLFDAPAGLWRDWLADDDDAKISGGGSGACGTFSSATVLWE